MTIPAGPFAYASDRPPAPLERLEQALLLSAVAGTTGWNFLHPYSEHLPAGMPALAASAAGRTFPSIGGFHTTEVFFTDDRGIYFYATRDAAPLEVPGDGPSQPAALVLQGFERHVRQLSARRLSVAPDPDINPHNRWSANAAGTTLVIPVADVAQQLLALFTALVQRGLVVYDDIHGSPIPGIEAYASMVDVGKPVPLSAVEQEALWTCAVEIAIACHNGMLALQAMGLGSWMFGGMDPLAVLGGSSDPRTPGLGFRVDRDARWSIPNPIGLPDVFEGFAPPRYATMRDAVVALTDRRFGRAGPFNGETPGPWIDSPTVRTTPPRHSDGFVDCVALMAQTVFDRFGKFPGTVPTCLAATYLQAHHLDLAFYDAYFGDNGYLWTHRRHDELWHQGAAVDRDV